jgi:hypothetical protein
MEQSILQSTGAEESGMTVMSVMNVMAVISVEAVI